MFKSFPIRLSLKIVIALVFFLGLARYAFFPLCISVRDEVGVLWSLYSGEDKVFAKKLETDRARLVDFERKALPQSDSTRKSAGYYDFLQETLQGNGIQAVRINTGDRKVEKNYQREDFSTTFSSTFHVIGTLTSDLENGPYFCSVKSLHIYSKSLRDNMLEAELSLAFYRLNR